MLHDSWRPRVCEEDQRPRIGMSMNTRMAAGPHFYAATASYAGPETISMPVQSDDKVGQALSALNLLETLRLLSATFTLAQAQTLFSLWLTVMEFLSITIKISAKFALGMAWAHPDICSPFLIGAPDQVLRFQPPHCLIILVHLSLGSADALD